MVAGQPLASISAMKMPPNEYNRFPGKATKVWWALLQVDVKAGQKVVAGQALCEISAMKMSTAVCATISGIVSHIAVDKNDAVDSGDLLVRISAEVPAVVAA